MIKILRAGLDQTPFVHAGLLAFSTGLANIIAPPLYVAPERDFALKSYVATGSSSTLDQLRSPLSGGILIKKDSLETVVQRFYQTLLSEQSPLDVEFAKVLHENLWDLYEE